MAFRTYKTLGEVLKKYQIMYQEDSFVTPENRAANYPRPTKGRNSVYAPGNSV